MAVSFLPAYGRVPLQPDPTCSLFRDVRFKGMADGWKHTLFIWRGVLDTKERTWKGAWCGTEDALSQFPSDEEFEQSDNRFDLTIANREEGTEEFTLSGYYFLDNGNGPQKYYDIKHTVGFFDVNGKEEDKNANDDDDDDDDAEKGSEVGIAKLLANNPLCTAKGETEFGRFISKGVVSKNTSGQSVLTLARRYLPARDARGNMSLLQVLGEVNPSNRDHPWTDLPHTIKKKARASSALNGPTVAKKNKKSRNSA